LTKEDIDRLVKESTESATADRKAREEADIRNEADQVCYLIEHQLKESGDKVRETNRSRAQMLIAELRRKVEQHENQEEIRKSIADLQGLLAMIRQDVDSPAPDVHPINKNASQQSKPDDDIIDAEVTAA
jgi:molecular chaperone DnaK